LKQQQTHEKKSVEKHQSKSKRGRSGRRGAVDIEMEDEEEKMEEAEISQKINSLSQQTYPDYLFVLTETFSCALMCYDQENHKIEVVSKGNIADKSGGGERREPPYSIFLSPCETMIVMMLYENVIKVIPLVYREAEGANIKMSMATNVRVRHSEVITVTPMFSK
jgi:hypothetical protein